MGLEHLHFVAPRSLEWLPDDDVAHRIHRALVELELVGDAPDVFDWSSVSGKSPRPKRRGQLRHDSRLPAEAELVYGEGGPSPARAVRLFDDGLCGLSMRIGRSLKIMAELGNGIPVQVNPPEGFDLAACEDALRWSYCQYLLPWDAPVPEILVPPVVRMFGGQEHETDQAPDAFRGAYRVAIVFDFAKSWNLRFQRKRHPRLPKPITATLADALRTPLAEGHLRF